MSKTIDFLNLRTSWTKYDIVRVMEVVYSLEITNKFKNREADIDEPILRSFLGVKSLDEALPQYWVEIQNFPEEKSLFALLVVIFTHGGIVKEFAEKYSSTNMQGLFKIEAGKQYTNIRSALIESGAAEPIYRRTNEVPYDLSVILRNGEVGRLFKQVISERFSRLSNDVLSDTDFYQACFSNQFEKALSLNKSQFKNWLEGVGLENNTHTGAWVQEVDIANFYSIENTNLNFSQAKEIYFLGENGDGKSLVLMAIYLAFNGSYITKNTDLEQTGRAVDIFRTNKRTSLQGIDDKNYVYNNTESKRLRNLFAYGTHRGRCTGRDLDEYGFMTLFDSDKTLTNPVSWLKDQKLLELEKRLDSLNMFPEEKLLPFSYSSELLEKMFFDLLERNVEVKINGDDVTFIEKGVELSFDQLSEGYKSILIFVSDLLFRLSKEIKEGGSVEKIKATVLVDEIDLHLHPKWQRVIIRKLRKIFPQVQFIFTTHSPTIIQGASDDAIIYRVYRNTEDGKTKVSDPYFRKDLNRLMINTLITSPLFGLEDSRLNSEEDYADTSETYLLYRINQKLEKILVEQRNSGKVFLSDTDIDAMIQQIISEELGNKDDKNN